MRSILMMRSARSAIKPILFGAASSAALAAMISSGALAQDDASARDDRGLDRIVVSARRFEESVQDAPLSVNVMDAESLRKQGIVRVKDVVQNSPGTTYQRFNKLQDEYSMRGIASQTEGTSGDSSVQTVIDNVVISKDFMKNPEIFDVSRIEVLRGPQGTSFGRNATAGLVHIISNRPTDEFEYGLTGEAGSHGRYATDGFINGPLGDTLSARLAFNFDRYDGYTESVSTGDGLDGQKNYAIRGSLFYEPSDRFSAYVKVEYSEDNDEGPVRRSQDCTIPQIGPGPRPPGPPPPPFGGSFTDPCDPFKTEISSGFDFFLDRQILNATAELVYNINDDFALTSVSGYLDGESDYFIDANGTPFNVLFQNTQNEAESFTQEIRLDNQASSSRLKGVVGFFFLTDEHDRFDENQFFIDAGLPGSRVDTFDTKVSTNDTTSYGIFGELNLAVTDRLTASFGGRWSRDEKDYAIAHFGSGFGGPIEGLVGCGNFPPGPPPVCGTPAAPVGFTTPVPVSDSWNDVSLKGSLDYAVNDNLTFYALVAQGYKTGGFQPEPLTPAAALVPFDEETATNYEIGFKGDFSDRLRLNVAAYKTKYKDLQLTQFVNVGGAFFSVISNAGAADVYGVEVESILQVTDDFRLSGSFSYLDSEFDEGTVLPDDDDPTTLVDFAGVRPDNVPDWTASVAGEYDIHFSNGSLITLRGDWRSRSEAFDDVNEGFIFDGGATLTEAPRRVRPGVDLVGVRAEWTSPNGRYSVAGWGRNLLDEAEIFNIGPDQPNTNQNATAFGVPRTWGFTVTVRR